MYSNFEEGSSGRPSKNLGSLSSFACPFHLDHSQIGPQTLTQQVAMGKTPPHEVRTPPFSGNAVLQVKGGLIGAASFILGENNIGVEVTGSGFPPGEGVVAIRGDAMRTINGVNTNNPYFTMMKTFPHRWCAGSIWNGGPSTGNTTKGNFTCPAKNADQSIGVTTLKLTTQVATLVREKVMKALPPKKKGKTGR